MGHQDEEQGRIGTPFMAAEPDSEKLEAYFRSHFLQALKRRAPEILRDLEDTCRPLITKGKDPHGLNFAETAWALAGGANVPLGTALDDWVKRWALPYWMKDVAVYTLVAGSKLRPLSDGGPTWLLPPAFTTAVTYRRSFQVSVDPSLINREEITESLVKDFRTWLRGVLDEVEEEVLTRGGHRGMQRLENEHFDWFVLFQYCGRSRKELALEFGRTGQAVRNALVRVSGVLEIPLRPSDKGGRPKGSKDIHR